MPLYNAIEFTDLECKVAQCEKGKGRPFLRVLFSFSLPRNDDPVARVTERAQLLRDAMKANKMKAQRVVAIIPKNYVMVRTVMLPSTDESELAGMARFEAERHIPFNAERHIVSHAVLAKQGVQGSQVVLVAVDEPVAREHLDICLKAGLQVDSLGVSSLSAFNGFAVAERNALTDRVVCLINVGNGHTDLVIANNGVVYFTRSSTFGIAKLIAELSALDHPIQIAPEDLARIDALEPQLFFRPSTPAMDIADAVPPPAFDDFATPARLPETMPDTLAIATEPTPASATSPDNKGAIVFSGWLLKLLQEVKKSYEFARREFNCPVIAQIYICGEGAQIRNLPQYFKVNFGIESVIHDPLRAMEVPPRILADLKTGGPSGASVIGGVLPANDKTISVNLLPADYLGKKIAQRQKQSYIVTGVLAFTAVVLAYIYVSELFETKREMLAALHSNNLQMKTKVAELDDQKTRFEIINRYVKDKGGALDILDKISGFPFIPQNVTLKNFEYNMDDSVKVSGYAKTIANINQMQSALSDTKFFDTVNQDSTRPTRLPGRGSDQVLEYNLTATFPKRPVKKPGAKPGDSTSKSTPAAKGTGDGT